MSAYIIAFVEVTDRERYAEYMKVTPSIVARFGGRFIARGGKDRDLGRSGRKTPNRAD